MAHPLGWAPIAKHGADRPAPFKFLERLEPHVTYAALQFLQQDASLASTIWCHDGFWVCPSPSHFFARMGLPLSQECEG